MARGMTKPLCLKIEKMAIHEISKVLGLAKDEYGDGGTRLTWEMPYGETGKVSISLFCDSHAKGHDYRSTWLACRLDDRERHVGEDGYTKPMREIEGGWPYPFTYPSGKCNLYFSEDMDDNLFQLATHMYSISAPDSKEKFGFGEIKFERNFDKCG